MEWYADEDVANAVRWVASSCATKDSGTVGYNEMLAASGLPTVDVVGVGQISHFMYDFHHSQGGIPYDSVVVNQETGLPGHGYWTVNDRCDPLRDGSAVDMRFWQDQQQIVWGHTDHPLADG